MKIAVGIICLVTLAVLEGVFALPEPQYQHQDSLTGDSAGFGQLMVASPERKYYQLQDSFIEDSDGIGQHPIVLDSNTRLFGRQQGFNLGFQQQSFPRQSFPGHFGGGFPGESVPVPVPVGGGEGVSPIVASAVFTKQDDLQVGSRCYFPCTDNHTVHISSCKDMEFRLYSRPTNDYDILITNNRSSVDDSSFNPSLPLLVVAHGYRENATTSRWMHDVKDKWLEKKPMNVILVQWAKLADLDNYCQAVRNTKCVGTKLANLINFLKNYTGLSPSDTHIIGFSLGAQLAGIAGHHVNSLSRITGLSPAGPGFYDVDLSERLDQQDATFVDIIHTNGGCFFERAHLGFLPQCGHVDFYMDGGSFQNGCPHFEFTDIDECILDLFDHDIDKCFNIIVDNFACSHRHTHAYYIESLTTSEPSYGYQCKDYAAFQRGLCLNNPRNIIGYEVTSKPTGKFYSNTQIPSIG